MKSESQEPARLISDLKRLGGVDGEERSIALNYPADLVQLLLFVTEFVCGARIRKQDSVAALVFFFCRNGGVRLLTHLLNAAYNKPPAGRPGGWPFNVLLKRVGMSERGLRMLLRDACAEGLVEKLEFEKDKRYVVYCVNQVTVDAWEKMFADMQTSMIDILDHFGPGELANIDYTVWDPSHSAGEQVPPSPVACHLKSASNRLAMATALKVACGETDREVDSIFYPNLNPR